MRRGSVLSAFAASAVHFQPMPAHSEPCGYGGFAEHVLHVASFQVCRCSTYRAQQVMVMSLVAELVAQFAVFQQDPTNLIGFHQQAQTPVYGGPAHAGQGGAQFFGSERSALSCNRADHQPARLGVPVSPIAQLSHDVVHHGGGTRSRVFVPGMPGCGCDQNDTPYRTLSPPNTGVNTGPNRATGLWAIRRGRIRPCFAAAWTGRGGADSKDAGIRDVTG